MSTTTTTVTNTITVQPTLKLRQSPVKLAGPYGDWRDQLASQGWVVIKGAVARERAQYYQQQALEWLKSFKTPLDLNDPSTWTTQNLPVQTNLNTFENYGVVHERFMWEARMEPGILEAFKKIWGTDQLLVSFDSLNVTLPNRKDKPAREPWPHVDQSPLRRGMHCIQGILNLSHAGPEDGSLVVIPGSHALIEEYFDTQTDSSTWKTKDNFYFSKDMMQWFEARGLKPMRVLAEPGDLLLWDSRTIHWGGEPTEKSDTIRTVIYAAYAPASMASKETLEEKKKVFERYGATTHWPHDNIFLREVEARLADGTLDPRNRSEPLEKPEYTDQLLKLAGVRDY